jgi:beta-galactosidase
MEFKKNLMARTEEYNHTLSLPMIGAQVFIEPGQTAQDIDTWFRILYENHLSICRIRLFENYMRTPNGGWDFRLFDLAFQAAEKYGIKILGTLFPATAFTDVGGFKFPRTSEHLAEIATYIQNLITHYRTSPALYGWVLINEPGVGELPDETFTNEKFKQWREAQPSDVYQSKGYKHFDFAEERFLLTYNTWFLAWLAKEIHKYDPGRHLHVNNHAIFQLAAEYDFPAWRSFLNSLGGSAHASWHFGYFQRDQYALAMAADCEMIRSGAGPIPWLMTEIQGGNNTYSGFNALCPTRQEITQWLWIIIGSGGRGGIFWCLNPRASGFEAGEWALIDFLDQPSERLQAAAAVSQVIRENEDLFANAVPVTAPIHILYIREALWVERRLQRGGIHYEGREIGGVIKSALGYFETLSEMGIAAQLGEISEFDFFLEDYTGVTIILAHQISLPSRYWPLVERFVKRGGKLIMDGLSAYYDENAHCIMKTGFPLADLCGASVKEFKLKGNLFDLELSEPEVVVPGHCWQGTLQLNTATPIGLSDEGISAVRNRFGAGEVLWVPSLLGLGARLEHNSALATLLYQEAADSIQQIPFRFSHQYPGVFLRTLQSSSGYITVLINKNSKPVELELSLPDSLPQNSQPTILASIQNGQMLSQNKFLLPLEETLVLQWNLA